MVVSPRLKNVLFTKSADSDNIWFEWATDTDTYDLDFYEYGRIRYAKNGVNLFDNLMSIKVIEGSVNVTGFTGNDFKNFTVSFPNLPTNNYIRTIDYIGVGSPTNYCLCGFHIQDNR